MAQTGQGRDGPRRLRVVVIGGAGVFGARLAGLLIRDGHEVILAGRSGPVAQAAALGTGAITLDRTGDLAPLWACGPDVVIDAAGPFHAYGADPYRLARDAIERRVHYLDLADDAAFCAGLSTLDAAAGDAGVVALSGVSSVPGLSSAIVADLARDADEIDTIRSAILPGNRAPRGRSVVDSILHQTGTLFETHLDGTPVERQSWSEGEVFDLKGKFRRRAYLLRVPDQSLFPRFFGARTVVFKAGLELAVMNHGLAVWSLLRRHLMLPDARWTRAVIFHAARLLHPFGTDTGGMVVEVTARHGTEWRRHRWTLIVRRGDGPAIPGVAARAVLRALDRQPPGAGPALARISRAEAEAAMEGLEVETATESQSLAPLFPSVVKDFDGLPAAVRASHDTVAPRLFSGIGRVDRGRGLWPNLIARLFGFPNETPATPVTVLKQPTRKGETWTRSFGARRFRSHLARGPHGMTERFGPFTFDLDLHVQDGALHYPVRAGRFGPIPLPRALLPRSEARETAHAGKFCYDVALYAPLTGQMVVRYRGSLTRASEMET